MNTEQKLNIMYDSLQKVKVVESVLAYEGMDEVKDLIKVKHSLTRKINELSNQLYDENKTKRS